MAKLTLKAATAAVGVGNFIEKTVKFRDVDGNDFEGEIFIKVISSEEISKITDVLNLEEGKTPTNNQYRDAMLLQVVFESKDKPFFPNIESLGLITDELKYVMYSKADEVINFSGKHWISMKKQNSSASSSAAESAEKPSPKQKEK